uniref:Uncharacterized protein n=1 Tax=Opuntia streptacantha TaxID=393608 RepID=A0A7C9EN10_OPUST
MMKKLQLGSNDHASGNPSSLRKLHTVVNDANHLENGRKHAALPSCGWKSGELEYRCHVESNPDSVGFGMANLKRSLSVGCEIDQKGRISIDDNNDYSIDQGFSCNGSEEHEEVAEVSVQNDSKSPGTTLVDQDPEVLSPCLSSDMVNQDSMFSVGEQQYLENETHGDCDIMSYSNAGGQATASSGISKSYSMPNFGCRSPTSPGVSPRASLSPQNKSFEGLTELIIKKDDVSPNDACVLDNGGLDKDSHFDKSEMLEGENSVMDDYDSFNYACSNKDWVVPDSHEIDIMKHDQEGLSNHRDHFPNQDFKTKLIEDWVVNLEHCSPVEDTNEIADPQNEVRRGSAFFDSLEAAKAGTKMNPGMEAAKRYISSLGASAATAQLANHGLIAIPLLCAFVSLKVLNLSGNSIVRITAGALPRGLHVLNLSKNKISTIEGLRELTRLRSLDLSYNKISRIGHGLASCASLKELYLAGNKISEVEGLHRLLKLTVLDLRFNKIATSKGLGQLAANYNSLQAISLEGNPAQKNVGDEQLKKCLQGLLPHLAYYNRQQIKSSTLKDSSDRSVRLGISGQKPPSSSRRGSALSWSASSCSYGRKGLGIEPPKQSKGRNGHLPPSGTKMSHHRHHLEMSNMRQSLRLGPSIQKSQSEGSLSGL